MMLTLVADHGPTLAQWAHFHPAVLDAQQQVLAQGGFLRKLGKAIFAFLAGIFIVGGLIGLLIGFFIGRAVGRNQGSHTVGS